MSATSQPADLTLARIATSLRAMEEHLDAAFAAGGEVASALVRARMSHNLSAVVGQPAFAAFGQATLSLTEARGHTVKGHRLLDQLARSLGFDVSMYGDTRKDDSDRGGNSSGIFDGG